MIKPLLLVTALAMVASRPGVHACGVGETAMSVEGVNQIFCVQGPICTGMDTDTGVCPGPQPGLPEGSYCTRVASGAFGCKAGCAPYLMAGAPAQSTTTATAPTPVAPDTPAAPVVPTPACSVDESEIRVEGMDRVFCVRGPVCTGTSTSTGSCPGPQPGLVDGSYCTRLDSGAFGCKAGCAPYLMAGAPLQSTSTTIASVPADPAVPAAPASSVAVCGTSDTEVSVEGINRIFCVQGPVCTSMHTDRGACPGPQPGLVDGSYCTRLNSGAFGCKPGCAPFLMATSSSQSIASRSETTAAATDAGTSPGSTTAVATGTVSGSAVSTPGIATTTTKDCPSGSVAVSVEGVRGIFCAQEKACVGTTTDSGFCPVAQPGLEDGSYCGIVASGVYGCKAGKPQTALRVSAPGSPLPVPVGQCPTGASPVTVEGVLGVFCVAEPACVGTTSGAGRCPGAHQELPNGSHCGVVTSGAFGCKPGSSPTSTTDTKSTVATTTESTLAATTVANPDQAAVSTGAATVASDAATASTLVGHCPSGSSPVSVVGVPRALCAADPICMGKKTNTGSCPTPQYELPNGSSCVWLDSGAFGCRAN